MWKRENHSYLVHRPKRRRELNIANWLESSTNVAKIDLDQFDKFEVNAS